MVQFFDWFLAMLYLHEQIIPSKLYQGGSPTQFDEIVKEKIYQHDALVCRSFLHCYETVGALCLTTGSVVRKLRLLLTAHEVPLVSVRIHRAKGGVALYRLTDAGRTRAEKVVANLSEECRVTLQQKLLKPLVKSRKRK
ncbi:MAG: hypothetical protein WEA04_05105 [Candidatus Andersenbacteria bacterium]